MNAWDFPTLSGMSIQRDLEACAIGLYWGEGAKSLAAGVVDLANSDPGVLQVFLRYLREIVRIDERRLRVYLYCFDDQDVESLKRFWSIELGIPVSQFTKPYIRAGGSIRTRKMPYGVAHVRYNEKKLLLEILAKIERLKAWAVTKAVNWGRL